MKRLFSRELEIKEQLFNVLMFAGIVSNIAGAISNAIIVGFGISFIVCCTCALLLILLGVIGYFTNEQGKIVWIFLGLLVYGEFPFLYYVYDTACIVYLLLGIIALAIFINGLKGMIVSISSIVYYVAIMVLERNFPWKYMKNSVDSTSRFLITIVSYFIVVAVLVSVTITMITEYKKQKEYSKSLKDDIESLRKIDPLTHTFTKGYITAYLESLVNNNEEFTIALYKFKGHDKLQRQYGSAFVDVQMMTLSDIIVNEAKSVGICARYSDDSFLVVFNNDAIDQLDETYRRIDLKLSGINNNLFAYSRDICKRTLDDDLNTTLAKLNNLN